ncbi:MAG: BACON domain-containing protein [Alistipes communis]
MKFLKYFCAASLLAASAGTLWSCDDDDDKRLSDAVLASVSSLTFEAQDTSEKIITVYADADWVTEIPDWVTVTPTEGTGVMDVTVSVSENMRDGAMDNPRKAKLVFKGRTLASRAEVLVSQVGNKFRDIPEYQKIGDVIALDDEAAVKIPSALVMAVTNKGFIISDDQQSGAIFVEDTEKVAVGDKVCVWGTKSSDGAKLPIISCAEKSDDPNREGDKVEVLSSGATVTYPTPTDLTEQIDTYTSAERSYVTVTGFFNGSTVSVADDAKYSVSALDIPEEMGLAKLNGHNITVSGYYAGLAEPVHRIIVTTIVDKGAVETVYWTEDFEWLEPWAIAGDNKGKQAGQTVEKDDLDAYCPQLPTSMVDGVSTLQALEAKGYEFLRVWDPSKDEDECIYLQKNYLKFGKTAYQAGIVLSNIEGVPEGKRQPSRSTGVRCDKVAARSIRSI